jgi:D-alanyl-D-alanine carboxypeptidase
MCACLQEINEPEDDVMTQDADALQTVVTETIRQIQLDEARVAKANNSSVQAAVRAAAAYACREVRRWESRAGTALAKRKRSSTKELPGDDGDEWEVATETSLGNGRNTIVLRKLRQSRR